MIDYLFTRLEAFSTSVTASFAITLAFAILLEISLIVLDISSDDEATVSVFVEVCSTAAEMEFMFALISSAAAATD